MELNSVCNLTSESKSDDRAVGVRFFITRMITDRIGRQVVLLQINHKRHHFREKNNSQVMKKGKICMKVADKAILDFKAFLEQLWLKPEVLGSNLVQA